MFNIGPLELMVILVVALLVVGPKRLPEVGRSIGRGLREFRRAQEEVRRTISLDLDDPASSPASAGPQPRTPDPSAPAAEGNGQPGRGPGPSTSGAAEIAGTIGQGIAELRRVREEIRRGFEVDLDDGPPTGASAGSSKPTSPEPEGEPDDQPPTPSDGAE